MRLYLQEFHYYKNNEPKVKKIIDRERIKNHLFFIFLTEPYKKNFIYKKSERLRSLGRDMFDWTTAGVTTLSFTPNRNSRQ